MLYIYCQGTWYYYIFLLNAISFFLSFFLVLCKTPAVFSHSFADILFLFLLFPSSYDSDVFRAIAPSPVLRILSGILNRVPGFGLERLHIYSFVCDCFWDSSWDLWAASAAIFFCRFLLSDSNGILWAIGIFAVFIDLRGLRRFLEMTSASQTLRSWWLWTSCLQLVRIP